MLYSLKKLFLLHPYLLPIMATSLQRPLSSVAKVAIVERFDCINIAWHYDLRVADFTILKNKTRKYCNADNKLTSAVELKIRNVINILIY